MKERHVLILGGTGEAAELALTLSEDPRVRLTTSLAGRTRSARALPGAVRVGGFGGAEGLAAYIQQAGVDILVDATHPYAAQISANAASAARAAGVALLRLDRAPWRESPGDTWIRVPDLHAAAAALPDIGRRFFLTVGRQELAPFAGVADAWYLVRLVERPEAPLPLPRAEVVVGRGPFGEADERTLLDAHGIDVVVSKNSGGDATYAKIAAARRLSRPVVMVERPPRPEGAETETSVAGALAWLGRHLD